MVDVPERIWAASVTENYGEWQTATDGLPRPTEYVRADLYAALEAENARLRKELGETAHMRNWNLRHYEAEKSMRERAEARLAEALKALGMMLKEHDILSGNFGDVMDPKHKRPDRWPTAAEAARRALKAAMEASDD